MDARQLTLDLWKRERDLEALRAECEARGLLESDVDFLLAVASMDGARENQSFACKTKRAWGCACKRDGNTAVAAMRRLERRGVLLHEVTPAGFAVLVDWRKVWDLAPAVDVRGKLEQRSAGSGEGLVRPGEGCARVLVLQEQEKTRVRVPCSVRAPRPEAVARRPRPWSTREGITGEDLVQAVARRDRDVLIGLYDEAVQLGWWGDSEQHRVKFLAICHHAATTTEKSPMGLLQHLAREDEARGKPPLDTRRVRAASEDWAAETRRVWRRGRDADERLCLEALAEVEL